MTLSDDPISKFEEGPQKEGVAMPDIRLQRISCGQRFYTSSNSWLAHALIPPMAWLVT